MHTAARFILSSAFLLSFGPLPRAAAQDARSLYEDACDAGDPAACNVFGLMLEVGDDVPRDMEAAADFYRRACDGGELAGCTNLGILLEHGLGVDRNPALARGRFQVACEGGEPLACERWMELLPMAAGEAERYRRLGSIVDAATSGPLGDVLIEIPSMGVRAVSDASGRVELPNMPRGRHDLRAVRLGYETITGMVEVPGDGEFVVLMEPLAEDLPNAPGRIRGRLTDGEGRPIAAADINVVGRDGVRAATNQEGRFVLDGVAPGLIEVRFSRLGHAPRTAFAVLQPEGEVRIDAVLPTEAIRLEAIEVTATGDASGYLRRIGFAERRNQGFGKHFDRAQIDATFAFRPSDFLRQVSGVRIVLFGWGNRKAGVVSPRCPTLGGGGSFLSLYLDGVRLADPDVNQIDLDAVEAIEVYHGVQTPVQYRGADNPCGVALFWTQR